MSTHLTSGDAPAPVGPEQVRWVRHDLTLLGGLVAMATDSKRERLSDLAGETVAYVTATASRFVGAERTRETTGLVQSMMRRVYPGRETSISITIVERDGVEHATLPLEPDETEAPLVALVAAARALYLDATDREETTDDEGAEHPDWKRLSDALRPFDDLEV